MEIQNTAISVTFAESEKMIFEKQVADTAECIIGAADEIAAKEFLRVLQRTKEHMEHENLEEAMNIICTIFRFFNMGKPAAFIKMFANTEEKKMFVVRKFIDYGVDLCLESIE